jgi:hypothetical protein
LPSRLPFAPYSCLISHTCVHTEAAQLYSVAGSSSGNLGNFQQGFQLDFIL